MQTSRRSFLGGLAAAAAGSAFAELPKAAPAIRLGVMTDTHVGKTVESCARVRQALELFREQGAELVINNGDIADHHYEDGYRAYRQVFNEVYASGPKPQEIYAYAWHDAFDFRGHPRDQVVADSPEAFEDTRKLLEAPHGHTAEIRFKDYTFLVMPQFTGSKGFLTWDDYEKRVAAACKANPGKPVFVVDHVPPRGTVYYSVEWGCGRSRKILEKYPQVVAFTGHVHGSIRSDRFIWQDSFTVINAGCLFGWDGLLAGRLLPVPGGARNGYDKQEWGVLTVDVYADRLVVRRWDVRDRREVAAPWVVPLPFVAATAPYRWQTLRDATPKAEFAPGAKVTATPVMKDKTFAGWQIDFTDSAKGATNYRIVAERRLADGTWGDRALCELFSDYCRRPRDRRPTLRYGMPAAYFAPSSDYRISVSPMTAFGDVGAPIFTEVKTPAAFAPSTVVWESKDPMKELQFVRCSDRRPYTVGADGFCGPLAAWASQLVLPSGLFAGAAGTRYRLTADVRVICPSHEQQPRIGLVAKGTAGGGRRGEYHGFGDVRSLRFAEVTVGATPVDYDLEIWEAGLGKVRFERLRLERLG